MITNIFPENWRALQSCVGRILEDCGFTVDTEKTIRLARGAVTVDVYAEEEVDGRLNRIMCECKLWKTPVPQQVIHGFRTIVADSGVNLGYIISAAGFQAGAILASELTNIRLVTWPQFQDEFEQTWIRKYLQPTLESRLDPLLSYIEPLLPRWFDQLNEEEQEQYIALKDSYVGFGWLVVMFTSRAGMFTTTPDLPIRGQIKPELENSGTIPEAILDIESYREFLELVISHGERAIDEFRVFRQLAVNRENPSC